MIDFVVPTYCRYEKTLRSVYSALYFCEKYGGRVIVIDNNSEDGSLEKLNSNFRSTSCVDVYSASLSCKGKPSLNWLEGLRACSSRYVHLLFSDDFLLPRFEQIYKHIHDSLDNSSSFLYCHIPSFYNEYSQRLVQSKYYPNASLCSQSLNPLYFRHLIRNNLFIPRSPCAFTFERQVAIRSLEKSHAYFSKYMPEAFEFGAGIDTFMIYNTSFESKPILFARSSTVSFTIHAQSITVTENHHLSKFYDLLSTRLSIESMSFSLRLLCFYAYCISVFSKVIFLIKRNFLSF